MTPRPSDRAADRRAAHGFRRDALAGIGVFALTFVVFSRVLLNGFVGYDDDTYITEKPFVRAGLGAHSLGYAFTDLSTGNWHPLTTLSHMFDCTVFGLAPAGHHLTGLILHSANAFLVYWLFLRMTGSRWPSVLTAVLFGIHPLHVASVAHAAQRKDVLSAFFWFLTMIAYARYATSRDRRAYAASLCFFALGLLSKSMLVTLPFVLLLLDAWPLRRMEADPRRKAPWARRVFLLSCEKLPFVALALAVGAITVVAQRQAGFVASLDHRPLPLRLENATISYVLYLWKTIVPVRLAAFYPYPSSIPAASTVAAAAFLCAVTVAAVLVRRSRPYFAVGWGWYLITLLPVVGVVQVGAQSMADRYSYIPLIGVFMAVTWGANDLVAAVRAGRVAVVSVCLVVFLALSAVSWAQLAVWRSPRTLWQHAIEVTHDNHLAYCNLGMAYVGEGRLAAAERCFREALSILPEFGSAKRNLANVLMLYSIEHRKGGRLVEAKLILMEALQLEPSDPEVCVMLGNTQVALREYSDAVKTLSTAVRLAPGRGDAHYGLGLALEGVGDLAGARREFGEALRIRPDSQPARQGLERARDRAAPGS